MKLYLSLLLGIGVGAWVFNKVAIRTHRNQSGIITALVAGLMAFLVFYTLLSSILKLK
ncbi:MAG TPA: hypothetical protein VMQ52_03675 [Candidatus Saccharimonadales bacterium]|jgi:hypothetical protein|nr:hypothetical protein [Candidatus Saccharimonadales bacterium]